MIRSATISLRKLSLFFHSGVSKKCGTVVSGRERIRVLLNTIVGTLDKTLTVQPAFMFTEG